MAIKSMAFNAIDLRDESFIYIANTCIYDIFAMVLMEGKIILGERK